MSTTLQDHISRQATSPAQRLRTTMAAVRVSMSWIGTRKSLTAEQKAEAAEPFGAEARFISAGKRLLDVSHPAFKAVTAVRGKVIAYWKSQSLPFPENGIRLIRQDRIEAFAAQVREFQEELAEAVEALDRRYSDLRTAARERLGSLYNSADYPDTLVGLFEISFDFPSVETEDTSLTLCSSGRRWIRPRVSTPRSRLRSGCHSTPLTLFCLCMFNLHCELDLGTICFAKDRRTG